MANTDIDVSLAHVASCTNRSQQGKAAPGKKLAIMQPYLLPYLGYWQLLAAVDTLVLLDDVHFINRGWINRNRIALDGKPFWLTLPLQAASQNRLICDIDLCPDDGWKKRMLRTLTTAYAHAREANFALTMFEQWLVSAEGKLADTLHASITRVATALEISTNVIPSSRIYPKGELRGQERILDICRREGASVYVNLPGGRNLYDAEAFGNLGIKLMFLEPDLCSRPLHTGANDGSVLSVLDALMHNPSAAVAEAAHCVTLRPE